MVPVALSDVIAVGEVPTADEIEILAKAGFRSLLNTQPDGEVARFATAAEAGVMADKAGLTYQHVPILSRRPDEASLEAFARALASLPRPIYACCYSGARTAAAWALAAAPQHEPDSIVQACASAGYDIAFLRAALAERRSVTLAQKATAAVGTPAAAFVAKVGDAVPAPAAQALPDLPLLKPLALLPRAATAGGFAVAG
jgi:uncharacterized protein (TIGR01244 family)